MDLEERVKTSFDSMPELENREDYSAMINRRIKEKEQRRKSLFGSLFKMMQGDAVDVAAERHEASTARFGATDFVEREDIFTVLNENAPFVVRAFFLELERKGLSPNEETFRCVIKLLDAMYSVEKAELAVTEHKIDAAENISIDVTHENILNGIIGMPTDNTSLLKDEIIKDFSIDGDSAYANAAHGEYASFDTSEKKIAMKSPHESDSLDDAYVATGLIKTPGALKELRYEFQEKYEHTMAENTRKSFTSILEQIEKRLLSKEGKEEIEFFHDKRLPQDVQNIIHNFCDQIDGVDSQSVGFKLENAEKTIKYCGERRDEILEFLWNGHVEKLVSSLWGKNMSHHSNIVDRMFPKYQKLREEKMNLITQATSVEDCDGDTQTGQAAQPADVAVDELKEREVYESLVDEIVSGLNYLGVAERNVELSKMCKVRVEIIEKEIRNVDLANLKKSQKTSGGNRRKVNKNLPNVHLGYFENCRLLDQRNRYYGEIIDDMLSIKVLGEKRKAAKLQFVENINEFIRMQIGRSVRWNKIDEYIMEHHQLFRKQEFLKTATFYYKNRDSTWNPIAVTVVPWERQEYIHAKHELALAEAILKLDQFYSQNLSLTLRKLEDTGINLSDCGEITEETLIRLQDVIADVSANQRVVDKKKLAVDKYPVMNAKDLSKPEDTAHKALFALFGLDAKVEKKAKKKRRKASIARGKKKVYFQKKCARE